MAHSNRGHPSRPSNLWESDCLMLSGSCRSMGMASSWQSPCTCACKKTGSSDKAFPQPAKPARLRWLRRELRGWKGDAAPVLPAGRGGGGPERPSAERVGWGRGCAGVNSRAHTHGLMSSRAHGLIPAHLPRRAPAPANQRGGRERCHDHIR